MSRSTPRRCRRIADAAVGGLVPGLNTLRKAQNIPLPGESEGVLISRQDGKKAEHQE
ncbi:hypothetical protein [Desulforudis sp. DRI-14]|uniref:hypothetical protein n=1 Tax=Desulforudis sp. DRI-14 TaxID=3459793 RepID=UPI004040ECFE